jgi:hypothetical protein
MDFLLGKKFKKSKTKTESKKGKGKEDQKMIKQIEKEIKK